MEEDSLHTRTDIESRTRVLTPIPRNAVVSNPIPSTSRDPCGLSEDVSKGEEEITPGKVLEKINPVPQVKEVENVRKRARNVATILTSPENLVIKKQKLATKKRGAVKNNLNVTKQKAYTKTYRSREIVEDSSSSDELDDVQMHLDDSDSSNLDTFSKNLDECRGCGEEYQHTTKKEDWIQCMHCKGWFHEGCSGYENICEKCGRFLSKKNIK
ncbi:hypothetical protein RN001_006688 [Aquatica leii]|uniref:Uncharacterized protein n=1 Tax=Aquatica leii TaxID=1421715 RepID=A0AAN7Q209_9COLE|nr:hypothetical protein RN001_006688 [Aquatica leii]